MALKRRRMGIFGRMPQRRVESPKIENLLCAEYIRLLTRVIEEGTLPVFSGIENNVKNQLLNFYKLGRNG